MKSSVSDNLKYPEFCQLASENDDVFNSFRQNSIYQEILEHFNYKDGLRFIAEITNENPKLLNEVNVFKTNDIFGGAAIEYYENLGFISPSTLHYVGQLSYLETYFGDLTDKHIVEIGGGYGGLCKLVIDRYNIASYTIFDLKPVNALIARYLGEYGTKYLSKIKLEVLENYKEDKTFDLCISNCAFTECAPKIQDNYLNKVIAKSSKGFILYNIRLDSYPPAILLSKLENCQLKGLGYSPLDNPLPYVFIIAWNSIKKLKKHLSEDGIFINFPRNYI